MLLTSVVYPGSTHRMMKHVTCNEQNVFHVFCCRAPFNPDANTQSCPGVTLLGRIAMECARGGCFEICPRLLVQQRHGASKPIFVFSLRSLGGSDTTSHRMIFRRTHNSGSALLSTVNTGLAQRSRFYRYSRGISGSALRDSLQPPDATYRVRNLKPQARAKVFVEKIVPVTIPKDEARR